MQQHPVPQNITGFEFRLIGALTLRQFGYLVTAGVLSFIFFVSVPSFLKWIFIIPVAGLGVAAAFVPVSGMPFDKWLAAFIKLITSPSKRVWHKEPKQISFLAPEFSYYLRRSIGATPTPSTRPALESFLTQARAVQEINKLDVLETTKLAMLDYSGTEKVSVIEAPPEQLAHNLATEPKEAVDPLRQKLFGVTHERRNG